MKKILIAVGLLVIVFIIALFYFSNQSFFLDISPIPGQVNQGQSVELAIQHDYGGVLKTTWSIEGVNYDGDRLTYTFKNPGVVTINVIASTDSWWSTSRKDSVDVEVIDLIEKPAHLMALNENDVSKIFDVPFVQSQEDAAIPFPSVKTNSRKVLNYNSPWERWSVDKFVSGRMVVSLDIYNAVDIDSAKEWYVAEKQRRGGISESVDIGDEGFYVEDMTFTGLTLRDLYVFRKQNVVVSIRFSLATSGNVESVDPTFVLNQELFKNLVIKQTQLVQLQEEKIRD